MAKKQTFGDKTDIQKRDAQWKTVKIITSSISLKTGAWKFNERFVRMPANEDEAFFATQWLENRVHKP